MKLTYSEIVKILDSYLRLLERKFLSGSHWSRLPSDEFTYSAGVAFVNNIEVFAVDLHGRNFGTL